MILISTDWFIWQLWQLLLIFKSSRLPYHLHFVFISSLSFSIFVISSLLFFFSWFCPFVFLSVLVLVFLLVFLLLFFCHSVRVIVFLSLFSTLFIAGIHPSVTRKFGLTVTLLPLTMGQKRWNNCVRGSKGWIVNSNLNSLSTKNFHIFAYRYRVFLKKVLHKHEEKMQEKMM